jgi:hydrogenase nickel incorporation protein HypB
MKNIHGNFGLVIYFHVPKNKTKFKVNGGLDDMDKYKVIEIKQSVFKDNDHQADLLRKTLKKDKTFLLNLMSSPGSGKTTTVLRTIEALKDEMTIGILEADIDSDVDASIVAKTGTKVIQLHTGGMCHLDADMTKQGLEGLGTEGIDFAILENVGNLVCPAEFDTGASKNAMILSVPEGDDKPLKYPLMFSIVDVLLVNKIDVNDYFDFDLEAVKERVKKLNPNIKVIPISAKKGEGIEQWADWIRTEVKNWNGR